LVVLLVLYIKIVKGLVDIRLLGLDIGSLVISSLIIKAILLITTILVLFGS